MILLRFTTVPTLKSAKNTVISALAPLFEGHFSIRRVIANF